MLSLPDAVEGADEFFVGSDGATGQEIEDEGDGGQHGGPLRTEVDSAPRLVASDMSYDDEADVPSHDEQCVEGTEKGLRLAVAEDEDGVGAEGCGGQQDGHQGPHVEMALADGIGEPEVVDTSHIDATEVEGTDLHTQTNDRQDNGH